MARVMLFIFLVILSAGLLLALAACEKSENQSAFGPRGTALPPPGLTQ